MTHTIEYYIQQLADKAWYPLKVKSGILRDRCNSLFKN